MKQVILLAGIGGQGVQVLGKLLAFCANAQGLQVTMDAKYSGNMRLAPSNCTVIVSDRMIGNPLERRADHLVAFTPQAVEKLSDRVVPGGTVWYDSTQTADLVQRGDLSYIPCPAAKLAEALGDARCVNMVMAGFLAARMGLFDPDAMRRCLDPVLGKKPQLLEKNKAAFERGLTYDIP